MTANIQGDFSAAREQAKALSARILVGDKGAVPLFEQLVRTVPLVTIKQDLSAVLVAENVDETDKDTIIDAAFTALPEAYEKASEKITSQLVLATILRERKNLEVYGAAIEELEDDAYASIVGARELYLAIGEHIRVLDRAQQNHLGFMLSRDITKFVGMPRPSPEKAELYLKISNLFHEGFAGAVEEGDVYRPAYNRAKLFPLLKPATKAAVFAECLGAHMGHAGEHAEILPFREPILQQYAPNWFRLRQQLNLAGGIAAFFGVPDAQDEPKAAPK